MFVPLVKLLLGFPAGLYALLVLHGTHDTICPITDGRRVTRAIRGARLIEIRGENHDPVRLLHAAAQQTREFLR